jgi:aerobic carbon-monoxide dehydrogenase medium subunit
LDEDGRCDAVAISLGAVAATPLRARGAEAALTGHRASDDRLDEAERLVREAAQPFADTRGSADYKRHLAGVMFRRAWAAALARL